MKKSEGFKAADLKAKTEDELKDLLLGMKKEQFNLRLQMSQGQLANSARVRVVRRTIARLLTIMSGKAEKASAPATVKKVSKPKAKKAAA